MRVSPPTASSPDWWPSPAPATGSARPARSCSAASPASLSSSASNLLEWLRIDDPIGAVPVHGFCGIWGTLSLGLFACGQVWRHRADRSGQLRAAEGSLLWRRHSGADGADHRQRHHHALHFRASPWSDVAVNATGTLRVLGGRRTLRPRPPRARHLGLSGVRDLYLGRARGYA